MNQGWECPKCKKVWAPKVKGCEGCNGAATAKPRIPDEIAELMKLIPAPAPDLCKDGMPHDFPSHQIPPVSCRKCGKVADGRIMCGTDRTMTTYAIGIPNDSSLTVPYRRIQ